MFLRYKWETGMLAWAMHRLTGVAVTFYLFLHVYTMTKLHDGAVAYNQAITTFSQPMWKVAEALLYGAVLYHAVNGMRVVAVDFFGAARQHARLFWTLMGATAALFAVGAWAIVSHAVRQ